MSQTQKPIPPTRMWDAQPPETANPKTKIPQKLSSVNKSIHSESDFPEHKN